MINLLPPDRKQDYRFARRNSSLLRMIAVFGLGLAGLAIIAAGGLLYLHQTAKTYAAQAVATENSLKEQKQEQIEKQVTDISNSLKLAVKVLSKEVLFSKLLKQLAVITPSNATLSGVSINQLEGGVDITAKTVDYDAATQLQINLGDPANKIFAKADIVSISCTAPSRYPCTVIMRALFATNNPFLFINSKADS